MNVSVSVNVCLKAYSKTGPHIHLVQEYSGAHASAARPPGGRSTALHDLYWATGCAVSMSNTRGVAVCDTHVTRTPRVLVTSNINTLYIWGVGYVDGDGGLLAPARTSRRNHCSPRQHRPVQGSAGGDFQLSPHNPSALPSFGRRTSFLALHVVWTPRIPGVAHLSWVRPAQNG